MDGFVSLGVVLRRCKLADGVELAKGKASQLEIRNAKALEMLKGMMKQEKDAGLLNAMMMEAAFMKARKTYLQKNKMKKSLLNKAVFIAQSAFSEEFAAYIRCRKELFLKEYLHVKDEELVEKMNALVQGPKAIRKILQIKQAPKEKHPHCFEEINLVFPCKETLELFQQKEYKKVIQKLKSSTDFESSLICIVAQIEVFKHGMDALSQNTDKKSKRTLDRYVTQWSLLYHESLHFFRSNFISTEYLDSINKAVPSPSALPPPAIPLHPVTYDVSSVYIQVRATSASQISDMMNSLTVGEEKGR